MCPYECFYSVAIFFLFCNVRRMTQFTGIAMDKNWLVQLHPVYKQIFRKCLITNSPLNSIQARRIRKETRNSKSNDAYMSINQSYSKVILLLFVISRMHAKHLNFACHELLCCCFIVNFSVILCWICFSGAACINDLIV